MSSQPPAPPPITEPLAPGQPPGTTAATAPTAMSRASLRARLVIVGFVVAAIVLTIFCAQNTVGTGVRFLAWGWPGAPLFAVILASAGLGFVVGAIFVWLRLVGEHSRARRLFGRRRH